MWCAISKLCTKQDQSQSATVTVSELSTSDKRHQHHHRRDPDPGVGVDEHTTMDLVQDTLSYDSAQSKYRASVKWLLSKAFNNRIPENLREPFYKDHENQEHLKPQIVGGLANSELYCLALGNIYSDPNYNNLNHTSILQTLSRKGVFNTTNIEITETILIQTNPLRIQAHIHVIESIMILYVKEVASYDQIYNAIERIMNGGHLISQIHQQQPPPSDSTTTLLLIWLNCVCEALQQRVKLNRNCDDPQSDDTAITTTTSVQDLKQLSNGIVLASLISYYCPDQIPITSIHMNQSHHQMTISESLSNLILVYQFCNQHLPPCSIFHMLPEDVAYFKSCMKYNLLVFLADLFNILEIHPIECVRYPGMDRSSTATSGRNSQGVAHKRNLPPTVVTPIPDLRSGLDTPPPSGANFTVPRNTSTSYSGGGGGGGGVGVNVGCSSTLLKKPIVYQSTSDFSEDSLFKRGDSDDSFIVHRNRTIPTLSSIISSTTSTLTSAYDEPLIAARLRPSKEKQNTDSKSDERGDNNMMQIAAGKPSNWEDTRKNSYAGRRSRRNSFSDDSQLTIENFGGSQDHIHLIGRHHQSSGGGVDLITNKLINDITPAVPIRSSLQDARGSIQLGYGNEDDDDDDDDEKHDKMKKSSSNEHLHFNKKNTININNNNNTLKLKDNNDTMTMMMLMNNEGNDEIKLSSFANLSKQIDGGGGGMGINNDSNSGNNIHIVYMQHDEVVPSNNSSLLKSHSTNNSNTNGMSSSSSTTTVTSTTASTKGTEKKTTTFATLPNTTTWQQQSVIQSSSNNTNDTSNNSTSGGTGGNIVMASQLNNIRMKLEEKRRHIESEKRRMELIMNKQRQKVGKAAFLQAITKNKNNILTRGAGDNNISNDDGNQVVNVNVNDTHVNNDIDITPPQRPFTLKEITDDAQTVENKWLNPENGDASHFIETRKTPDIENMDLEQYQQSLAMMNNSLHDIQVDIQRLASQQNQIQHQNLLQHQQQQQQQQMAFILAQQQQQQQQQPLYQHHYGSQHNISTTHHPTNVQHLNQMHNMFSSVSHIPQQQYSYQHHQQLYNNDGGNGGGGGEFYLHDNKHHQISSPASSSIQRRTWSTPTQGGGNQQQLHNNTITTSNNNNNKATTTTTTTWKATTTTASSDNNKPQTLSQQHLQDIARYQNGGQQQWSTPSSSTSSPQHHHHRTNSGSTSTSIHRQISHILSSGGGGGDGPHQQQQAPVNLKQIEHQDRTLTRSSSALINLNNINVGGGGGGNNGYNNTSSTGGTSTGGGIVPVPDDMEPQNISFIGNNDTTLTDGMNRLNITSGTRTYRIPSPTRQYHHYPHVSSIQQQQQQQQQQHQHQDINNVEQKGFYISFDDNEQQPKRPKPPLRGIKSRSSPKKERSSDDLKQHDDMNNINNIVVVDNNNITSSLLLRKSSSSTPSIATSNNDNNKLREKSPSGAGAAIIIGAQPDPNSLDEMEKKKERIMLLSLQRRQQQEEMKARKEAEILARREHEKQKEDERLRKKEEQAQRRQIILEQYKLKKAIEEAEREGKIIDKTELMNSILKSSSTTTTPPSASLSTTKLRGKTTGRPRPKTIHVDSGSVELAEGMLTPSSRGKKGSTSNLTSNLNTHHTSFNNNTNTNTNTNTISSLIRRDYYRGSHDSLADSTTTSNSIYRDSPDDGRGASPCCNVNQTLGRRASYKTSRENNNDGIRGRSKYSTYQSNMNLRIGLGGGGGGGGGGGLAVGGGNGNVVAAARLKSNSMMNLCGSSSDQDSMMYRYGDTDSGLGRATPPRRAPSPGMSGGVGSNSSSNSHIRHLTSPSGPGSLPPGLMTTKQRRIFDDGCSDISSTPSSMMDYSGPRLYKQPTTKSNRGIMLNAVEYCVFPGVVNKEAKNRVLEEIARSESKHFLILFRDAGCQFRALYSYCPEREEVQKLYGTGPKQVNDRMFDKFFKYNSGGKCFSQVHTKHLTVTIDAFTIHNSLWQGKKVNLPNKKDMALVI